MSELVDVVRERRHAARNAITVAVMIMNDEARYHGAAVAEYKASVKKRLDEWIIEQEKK